MGSGASFGDRSPDPKLSERLRMMLILRAYNCRPRDWTMKEQFDAVAENGLLTKVQLAVAEIDRLRSALRLSECPRIEKFLDLYLFDSPGTSGATKSSAGGISVSDLIAFVNSGNGGNVSQHPLADSGRDSGRDPPSPPPSLTRPPFNTVTSTPEQSLEHVGRLRRVEGSVAKALQPPVTAVNVAVTPADEAHEAQSAICAGVGLRCPQVMPTTLRRVLSAATANQQKYEVVATTEKTSDGQEEKLEQPSRLYSSRAATGDPSGASSLIEYGYSSRESLRPLGAVDGLEGGDGHRRQGPVHPVWRKRETLVQERTVQYTTLDEKGTVQDMFEVEKSQTEVLQMECKHTDEYAHRESTHYQSGETLNGEVVGEEAGEELYVHFRSGDDEYEHVESTLPPRSRQGDATTGTAGNRPPQNGADTARARASGGANSSDDGYPSERHSCVQETPKKEGEGETEAPGGTDRQRCTYFSGAGENRELSTAIAFSARDGMGACDYPDDEDSAPVDLGSGSEGIDNGYEDVGPGREGGDGNRRSRPPFLQSAYHCISPMCSPRPSSHPLWSPCRDEGMEVKGNLEDVEYRPSSQGDYAGAQGQTVGTEEGASKSMREFLSFERKASEERESPTVFARGSKQDATATPQLWVPLWVGVEQPERLTPRGFAAPVDSTGYPTCQVDDGAPRSVGSDTIPFFFPSSGPIFEPCSPWVPPPRNPLPFGADTVIGEKVEKDETVCGSGSFGDEYIPSTTSFGGYDGYDGDLERTVSFVEEGAAAAELPTEGMASQGRSAHKGIPPAICAGDDAVENSPHWSRPHINAVISVTEGRSNNREATMGQDKTRGHKGGDEERARLSLGGEKGEASANFSAPFHS